MISPRLVQAVARACPANLFPRPGRARHFRPVSSGWRGGFVVARADRPTRPTQRSRGTLLASPCRSRRSVTCARRSAQDACNEADLPGSRGLRRDPVHGPDRAVPGTGAGIRRWIEPSRAWRLSGAWESRPDTGPPGPAPDVFHVRQQLSRESGRTGHRFPRDLRSSPRLAAPEHSTPIRPDPRPPAGSHQSTREEVAP